MTREEWLATLDPLAVFGIPFQHVIPDPAWRTSTMPILGDSLQDA